MHLNVNLKISGKNKMNQVINIQKMELSRKTVISI